MAYTDYANAICHKTQNAAAAMLQAAVTGGSVTLIASASIFAGIGRSELPLPRVVCVCKRAQQEDYPDAVWAADLTINIYASSQDTTEDDFHELCGQVYSRFFQAPATVQSELSNSALEFSAHFVVAQSQAWDLVSDDDDAHWTSELNLLVKCCGSYIA